MRVIYLWTQAPGYGGASTEAYLTVQALRARGVDVVGRCIDHCGGCNRCPDLPYEPGLDSCDPDDIGGIEHVRWCRAHLDEVVAGDCDIMVGKNYGAAQILRRRSDVPTVYVTSGIDYLCQTIDAPYTDVQDREPPAQGNDLNAMRSVDRVIVHSSLDLAHWRRHLPPSLRRKLWPEVIRMPDLCAVREFAGDGERPYDVAFIASDWTRAPKGTDLAVALSAVLFDRRVVVLGENWPAPLPNVETRGLVSHADALDLLTQTRVLVIPSWLDSAPNVYAEAVACGCDVVVSPCIGNADDHPDELLARDHTIHEFHRATMAALALDEQAEYRQPDPAAVIAAFETALTDIVAYHRRVSEAIAKREPGKYYYGAEATDHERAEAWLARAREVLRSSGERWPLAVLASFVTEHVPMVPDHEVPSVLDPVEIMEAGGGVCKHHVIVWQWLVDQLLGLQTRRIELRHTDGFAGHIVGEALVDGRWVVCDVTYGILFEDGGDLCSLLQLQDAPDIVERYPREWTGLDGRGIVGFYLSAGEATEDERRWIAETLEHVTAEVLSLEWLKQLCTFVRERVRGDVQNPHPTGVPVECLRDGYGWGDQQARVFLWLASLCWDVRPAHPTPLQHTDGVSGHVVAVLREGPVVDVQHGIVYTKTHPSSTYEQIPATLVDLREDPRLADWSASMAPTTWTGANGEGMSGFFR